MDDVTRLSLIFGGVFLALVFLLMISVLGTAANRHSFGYLAQKTDKTLHDQLIMILNATDAATCSTIAIICFVHLCELLSSGKAVSSGADLLTVILWMVKCAYKGLVSISALATTMIVGVRAFAMSRPDFTFRKGHLYCIYMVFFIFTLTASLASALTHVPGARTQSDTQLAAQMIYASVLGIMIAFSLLSMIICVICYSSYHSTSHHSTAGLSGGVWDGDKERRDTGDTLIIGVIFCVLYTTFIALFCLYSMDLDSRVDPELKSSGHYGLEEVYVNLTIVPFNSLINPFVLFCRNGKLRVFSRQHLAGRVLFRFIHVSSFCCCCKMICCRAVRRVSRRDKERSGQEKKRSFRDPPPGMNVVLKNPEAVFSANLQLVSQV